MAFKVTAATQGTGRAVVTATGMDTARGEIARMLGATATATAAAAPLERAIALVGEVLGAAVVTVAPVVMARSG